MWLGRGARVTIGRFRRVSPSTRKKHRASADIVSNRMIVEAHPVRHRRGLRLPLLLLLGGYPSFPPTGRPAHNGVNAATLPLTSILPLKTLHLASILPRLKDAPSCLYLASFKRGEMEPGQGSVRWRQDGASCQVGRSRNGGVANTQPGFDCARTLFDRYTTVRSRSDMLNAVTDGGVTGTQGKGFSYRPARVRPSGTHLVALTPKASECGIPGFASLTLGTSACSDGKLSQLLARKGELTSAQENALLACM